MKEKIIKDLENLIQSDKYKERISYALPSNTTGWVDMYATTTPCTGGSVEISTKYFELSIDKIRTIIILLKYPT